MICTSADGNLRKVLGRFKRDEFVTILKQWGSIRSERLSDLETAQAQKGTRKALIECVLQICVVKPLTVHAVAELDLLYQQFHPNNKKWSVFQLTKNTDCKRNYQVTTPDEFRERLGKQLSFYFQNDLCVRTHNEAWWVRLMIQEGSRTGRLPASNVIYAVHHPHSNYIILSVIKVSLKDFVMQSLLNSLDCSEIREIQLTGRDLDSLTSLALQSKSQGWFSKFRLNQVDHNPLSRRRKSRKRKAPASEAMDSEVIFENLPERERQEEQVVRGFGSSRQPKLQKIEYKLETRFRGTEFAPVMALHKEPFLCRVKFEGSNVLEGIRSLAKEGIASLPLPHHLSNVHSLAKNHFVLADKKHPHAAEAV